MIKNYNNRYEMATSDTNFPARIIYFDKPGSLCYINNHKHKDIEIDYIINGSLQFNINGNKRLLKSSEFEIINSNEIHSTDYIHANEQVGYLVIFLSYGFMKNYMPDFDKYKFEIPTPAIRKKFESYLRKIFSIIKGKDEFAELRVLSILVEIIETLFIFCKKDKDEKEIQLGEIPANDYSNMAIAYIKEHFREQITLEDVANYVGFSKTYFSKYFKQKNHKTFLAYLNEIRLANAILDIENNDFTETVAATKNGFPNVRAFIKTFKDIYKYTPTEYMRINKKWPNVYVFDKKSSLNQFL